MENDYKPGWIERFRQLRETRFGSFVPVLLALAVIWAYFSITEPAFFSARNFYFLFMQSAVVGTLAVGITMVLLLGDIDLSVAANSGVCAALLAVLIANFEVAAPIACILAIGLGVLLSTGQGILVSYVGIPSFVVTLAGLLGFQGLMLKILGIHGAINVREPFVRGITTVVLPPYAGWLLAVACVAIFSLVTWRRHSLRKANGLELDPPVVLWGQVAFFAVLAFAAVATLNAYRGVPLLVVLLVGLTAILGWIATSTPFGRSVFCRRRQSGIRTPRRHECQTHPGLPRSPLSDSWRRSAVLSAHRVTPRCRSTPLPADRCLLEAIGAAVIGGTSLFGGRGSVWNAILGALVIGSLGNGLDLSGASAADKLMFSGAILLLAVAG